MIETGALSTGSCGRTLNGVCAALGEDIESDVQWSRHELIYSSFLNFNASTDAQAGAYATGVLFVMSSAAVAVTLVARRNGSRRSTAIFAMVTLVLAYTTVANTFERPDGIKIASFFIAAIVVVSLASRVQRPLELRHQRIELDEEASRFIKEASNQGDEIHIIAHRRRSGNEPKEYARKLAEQQEFKGVPKDVPVLFLEVDVEDASEFEDVMEVRGVEVGDYKVLRAESAVVPNAIAAFLLYLQDETGGSIAQQFAADRPELVRRLVLAGTACRLGPVARDAMRRHAQLAAWGQYRRSAAALAPTITGSALGQRLAGAAMWLAAPLGGMGPYWDPSDMIATVEAEDAFDASERLEQIRAPTLVIGGERDPFIEGYVFLT